MKFISLFSLLFFPVIHSSAQNKQQINIEHADLFSYKEVNGVKLKMLVGNVWLSQKDLSLFCDSANFYNDENRVEAFGNVHIQQSDSVDVYGEILKYNGNTRKAVLKKNVVMTDHQMKLTTDTLYYDIATKTGKYLTGGTLLDGQTKLFSKRGYYYSTSDDAFFKDSVVLIDPQYTLTCDTLQFNSKTHRAIFHGNTVIVSEESTILCSEGWYDTEQDIASFGKNTSVVNDSQTLNADSLYYNRNTAFGQAMKNVVWNDAAQNLKIESEYAEFYERNDFIIATDHALLTDYSSNDSFFLTADTLKSNFDSLAGYRNFFAYHQVKMFRSNLQGVCDSLFFSYKDSVFRMFDNPVLWNDENQLLADTIRILMKNKTVDGIQLISNAFICNRTDEGLFNQIKGRNIYGYFKDEELNKMYVEGNGESVYYGQNDAKAYVGVNKSTCSNMWVRFANQKVDRITFLELPEATFTPMQKINPADFMLENFIWLQDERPESKNDLVEGMEDL